MKHIAPERRHEIAEWAVIGGELRKAFEYVRELLEEVEFLELEMKKIKESHAQINEMVETLNGSYDKYAVLIDERDALQLKLERQQMILKEAATEIRKIYEVSTLADEIDELTHEHH